MLYFLKNISKGIGGRIPPAGRGIGSNKKPQAFFCSGGGRLGRQENNPCPAPGKTLRGEKYRKILRPGNLKKRRSGNTTQKMNNEYCLPAGRQEVAVAVRQLVVSAVVRQAHYTSNYTERSRSVEPRDYVGQTSSPRRVEVSLR